MQLMAFNDPALLDETQTCAVVAFMLAQHGAITPTDQIDRSATAQVPVR